MIGLDWTTSDLYEAVDGRKTWANTLLQRDLHVWERDQQHFYHSGTLDPQREARLAEIGYWRYLDLYYEREDTWQAMFEGLVKVKEDLVGSQGTISDLYQAAGGRKT